MKHTAKCTCEKVTFQTDSEPYRVSICHCFECQRRTGSVFGVQARFNKDDAQVSGDTSVYVRRTEGGNEISFHFCPTCSSIVYWYMKSQPEMIGTAVGNFTEPSFGTPSIAVFEHRKHDWVDTSDVVTEQHNKISQ